MKKDKVSKQIDYYGEAVELLYHMVNEQSFSELKESLIRKCDGDQKERISKALEQLVHIENSLVKKINIKDSELQLFFSQFIIEEFCIAKLLYHATIPLDDNSSEEHIKETIIKETERSLLDDINEFSIVANSLNINKNETEQSLPLMERIDQLDCSDGDKWRLYHISQHIANYVDRLFLLLDDFLPLLKEYKHEMEDLFYERAEYWTDYFHSHKMKDFINDAFQLKDIPEKNYILQPCIFACNKITMQARDEDHPTFLLGTGIIFDSSFRLSKSGRNKEEMCNGLKVLSDSSKFEILQLIKEKASYGQELAKEMNLSTATISHHMNSLLSYGFIKLEKVDSRIYYSMDKKVIQEFLQELNDYL